MIKILKKFSAWIAYIVLLLVLPQIFDSVLAVSIFNQMAIAIVFALSYNMLLGQGGMLSFGHAVYFGLGGFLAVHGLLLIESEAMHFSIIWIPLVGGSFGLLAAIFIGSFSTKTAGTVFAMISLGIGEMIAASSLIFVSFFGGELGISGDRTFGPPFFGIEFLKGIEIYYVAIFWVFVATLFMYLFTQTPVGRMANAVRDNPERAEFIGYSSRRIRFLSFCASGLFAGIAGGMYALNYEFITDESVNAINSGSVLLMAYIGGLSFFIGPIIGAIILTLMNSLLNNFSELWMLYLGVLFLLTVLFLPQGFAGFIMMHRVAWISGTLRPLLLPYLITGIPATVCLMASIALIELGHRGGRGLYFLGASFDRGSVTDWLIIATIAIVSFIATRRSLPRLREAWCTANTITKEEEL